MEQWGVTSGSRDLVDRFRRHVLLPYRNHTASALSQRPAPDTSDLSSRSRSAEALQLVKLTPLTGSS